MLSIFVDEETVTWYLAQGHTVAGEIPAQGFRTSTGALKPLCILPRLEFLSASLFSEVLSSLKHQ